MSTPLDLTFSESVWRAVTQRLEAFLLAWEESDNPPSLEHYLPNSDSAERLLCVVELIKVDIEHRYSHGFTPRSVEDYAQQFPEIVDQSGFCEDLIYEEFHLRRLHGCEANVEEYVARFPDQAERLRRRLGTDRLFQTTCIRPVAQIPTFEMGQQVDDFEILAQLGKGAFAQVYLARQISMQRQVALKVSACRGREPQMLAQLDHPHIVRVYDQRTLEEPSAKLLYMEYVTGGTLLDVVDHIRRVPPNERSGRTLLRAVDLILQERDIAPPTDSLQRQRLRHSDWGQAVTFLGSQIAEALAYAGQRGVLHRDLKPANILMSKTATPKLADFNVSDCSGLEGVTAATYFGGSLAYMSPEQLEAIHPSHERTPETLTAASDIYALGIVLWELATGNRPFRDQLRAANWSKTFDEMIARRCAGIGPQQISEFAAVVPGPLCEVLTGCIEPDLNRRIPNAQTLADQLKLALHPEAHGLLRNPLRGLRWLGARWPVMAIVLTVLIPNIMAGWFNYTYNFDAIVQKLPGSQLSFRWVSAMINGVAFPIGLLIGLKICWPVTTAVRERFHATEQPMTWSVGEDETKLRLSSLRLGHVMAVLGMVCWGIAGVAFPIALILAGAPLSKTQSIHFVSSLVLCGMIGASYPFFAVSVLVLDVWYPLLMRPNRRPHESELACYDWLERISARYFVLAGAVPLLSVGLLTLLATTQNRLVLMPLSFGGFVVMAIVFRLHGRIVRNLRLLAAAFQDNA